MQDSSQNHSHLRALSLADSYKKQLPPDALHISIIGNCHYEGIFQSMRLINPLLTFDVVSHLLHSPSDKEKNLLLNSDFIFVSDKFDISIWTDDHIRGCVINFPSIFFKAFHPDILRIQPTLPSFYPTIHSRILVECFLRGYSEAKALEKFCSSTYIALGYYNYLSSEREKLVEHFAKYGIHHPELLPTWFQDGCFMHLAYHPRIKCIKDLTLLLMQQHHIPIINHNIDLVLIDHLADTVWPVYPDIAERLCIPKYGSYMFKSKNRVIDLAKFISISYAIYGMYDMDKFNIERIDF